MATRDKAAVYFDVQLNTLPAASILEWINGILTAFTTGEHDILRRKEVRLAICDALGTFPWSFLVMRSDLEGSLMEVCCRMLPLEGNKSTPEVTRQILHALLSGISATQVSATEEQDNAVFHFLSRFLVTALKVAQSDTVDAVSRGRPDPVSATAVRHRAYVGMLLQLIYKGHDTAGAAIASLLWSYLTELDLEAGLGTCPPTLLDELATRVVKTSRHHAIVRQHLLTAALESVLFLSRMDPDRPLLAMPYVALLVGTGCDAMTSRIHAEIEKAVKTRNFSDARGLVLLLASLCARSPGVLDRHVVEEVAYLRAIALSDVAEDATVLHAVLQGWMYLVTFRKTSGAERIIDEALLKKLTHLSALAPSVLGEYDPLLLSSSVTLKKRRRESTLGGLLSVLSLQWFPCDPCTLRNLSDEAARQGYRRLPD